MAKVAITESYLQDIADAIREKTGLTNLYYPSQMAPAIMTISGSGGITPTGTISITTNGTYNVTQYASASVAVPTGSTISNQNKSVTPTKAQQQVTYDSGYTGLGIVTVNAIPANYIIPTGNKEIIENGTNIDVAEFATVSVDVPTGSTINNQNKTVNPSTSQQSITADSGYTGLGTVTVNAMPTGTAGTPSASKGTVSNHTISITPSVTNTTGYITGSTKTGTAVTVSASELVSGTYTVDSSGTKDVTNYANASVPSGTAGTPSASKGTVSNHSISVTPSVTNTTGWITGSTKSGTAVTVTASELASGNKAITQNGTGIDVVGYSTVSVDVPSGGGVTVSDVANTTGTTCVITTGSAPSEDIPLNTQLIDFTAVKSGYIVDGDTGEETVSQWSSCSDFTLIDPSMTFSYIGYQWYNLVFYDTSKNYISSIYMSNDADNVTNDYAHGTLTPAKIPQTAKYVRINTYPHINISSTQLSLIRTA